MQPNPLYVSKETLNVSIVLSNRTQIEGTIHLAPRNRLTDVLNFQATEKPFLPVTNAHIVPPEGEEKSVPFLIINRHNIITCIPQGRGTTAS